jgi:multiple sugar transport system substrate-binding protein
MSRNSARSRRRSVPALRVTEPIISSASSSSRLGSQHDVIQLSISLSRLQRKDGAGEAWPICGQRGFFCRHFVEAGRRVGAARPVASGAGTLLPAAIPAVGLRDTLVPHASGAGIPPSGFTGRGRTRDVGPRRANRQRILGGTGAVRFDGKGRISISYVGQQKKKLYNGAKAPLPIGEDTAMRMLSRRSVLRTSLGLAAAGALSRPYIARAEAKTATVWWTQGFVPEEDASFRAMVAEYEKQSGNKIDYSLIPFGPLMQKIVSAITSGDVPDVMSHDIANQTVIPQNAWHDKLVDVSDVVETQKAQYLPTAYLAAQFYNSVEKKRGFYLVPFKAGVLPFHVWNSLVEKAGLKLADAPKKWDAFWDFFKPVQQKLRDQGQRGVYSLGLQATTTGPADGNNTFHAFLIANGGNGIVTQDGRAHLDDPQVMEAVIKSLTYIAGAVKDGFVPPGAVSWTDADDNNAFHAKQIVIDLDGTISTEVALYHNKDEYNDIATLGLPLDNSGKPNSAQLLVDGAFIPKGGKNVEVAKDFLKYVVQPQVTNAYLKAGLGRWLPVMPGLLKSDAFWLDPKDSHRLAYVKEGLVEPTVVSYPVFNPGYAEVNAQQIWGVAVSDILRNGMSPQAAAKSALTKVASILAKYPIAQT